VHRHQLRHSYAVHMLALLIRQRFDDAHKGQDLSSAAYRRLLGDPLQQVQPCSAVPASPRPRRRRAGRAHGPNDFSCCELKKTEIIS
jgi:hypothetical protein